MRRYTFYIKSCNDCPCCKYSSVSDMIVCSILGRRIGWCDEDIPDEVLPNCPLEKVADVAAEAKDSEGNTEAALVSFRQKRQIDL